MGGSAASSGTLDQIAENSEEKKQLALGCILEIRLMGYMCSWGQWEKKRNQDVSNNGVIGRY